MPLRTRIFILVTIVVLFVLGVSIFLIVESRYKPSAPAVVSPTSSGPATNAVNPGTEATVIPQNVTVMPATSGEVTETTVRQLAKIFVERFNTYSSDTMYQNIRDVQTIVSDDYWKKISLPLTRPSNPPAAFVALTTRVLAITSSEVKDYTATVVLKAQKDSTNGATTATTYSDFTVLLSKSGTRWLVSDQSEKK